MLTPEQVAAIDTYTTGVPLKVIAFAGAGKTTTLTEMAKRQPYRNGLYVAFNKSIAEEAGRKFTGTRVQAKTAHSLAFRTVAGMGYDPAKMTSTPKSWTFKFTAPAGRAPLSDSKLRSIVASTITRFCQSWDADITSRHVPHIDGLEREKQAWLNAHIPAMARQVWEVMTDKDDPAAMGHDGYLKLWALTNPVLPTDFLLVDEAQDLNSVLIGIVRNQSCQVVSVGDSHQQIYAWRGAVDALKILPGAECRLTQSFRFGRAIAQAANQVLLTMGETHPLRGNFTPDSVIFEDASFPDAILCRGNAGVIGEAINWHERGRQVHTPGGTNQMRALVRDAESLMSGGSASTDDLMAFETWADVKEYAETDEGTSLRAFTRLVDRYGCKKLTHILSQIHDREVPGCITVATGHKSKGLEWNTVQINDDFQCGDNPGIDERRLFYVAMTRARRALHVSGETFTPFATEPADHDDTDE